jgi:hypothetical protein
MCNSQKKEGLVRERNHGNHGAECMVEEGYIGPLHGSMKN